MTDGTYGTYGRATYRSYSSYQSYQSHVVASRFMTRRNVLPISLAILGIAIEAIAIYLLGAKRIPTGVAVPLIVAGMFLGFVPIFVVARRARR